MGEKAFERRAEALRRASAGDKLVFGLVLQWHVYRWARATDMQAERVLGPVGGGNKQADALLFCLSLNNLIRAAGLAVQLKVPLADEVLDSFLGSFPDAKSVRDIIEHFDDYELGIGKLQNSAPSPSGSVFSFSQEHPSGSYRIHLFSLGVSLDVRAARGAARTLAQEILSGLERQTGYDDPFEEPLYTTPL